MKISPIGPAGVTSVYTELFSQPVIRSYSKSQKGRLLVNQLEPKDRVTISPEARMLSILRQQSQYEAIAKMEIEYKFPEYRMPVPDLPQKPPVPPDRELQPPSGKPDPLHGQPPVVAIPEQRHPEPPDPTHEAPKTPPIAPVPPLQNPEQSISRDQIEPYITDGGNHG